MEKQQPALAEGNSGKSVAPPSHGLSRDDETKAKLVLWLGLALAVIGAAAGGWCGWSIAQDAQQIASSWTRVEAVVTEIAKRGTLKKPRTHVSVSYVVGGKPGSTSWQVGRSTSFKTGDKVAVFVSPSDPSEAKLAATVEADAHKSPSSLMWRGIAIGFFGAPLFSVLLLVVFAAGWTGLKKAFGQA